MTEPQEPNPILATIGPAEKDGPAVVAPTTLFGLPIDWNGEWGNFDDEDDD